jgi:HEAT repeat protein
VLSSDSTRAGKQFVCRELSIIGTEQSVPVLAKMLTDEETSDMARYALERIPGNAVNEALRAGLAKTSGKTKVGIINSLGERRDARAVSALGKLISDSEEMVAEAAASALGKIRGSRATEILAKAKDKTSGKLRLAVLDAYLQCADQLAAEGENKQARAIYKELYDTDMPGPIRIAAQGGMLRSIGQGKKRPQR